MNPVGEELKFSKWNSLRATENRQINEYRAIYIDLINPSFRLQVLRVVASNLKLIFNEIQHQNWNEITTNVSAFHRFVY